MLTSCPETKFIMNATSIFRCQTLLLLFINLCGLLAPAFAVSKTLNIRNVSLRNGVLKVPHDSYSSIKFAKKIYSNPYRLVFDIYDAKLMQGKQTYNLGANSSVKNVTVAQFEPGTVRIVIECESKELLSGINIDNIGQTIYFNLAVSPTVIEDIRYEGGNLYIIANKPVNLRTIKLDNPERLVIDIVGAHLRSNALKTNIVTKYEVIKVSQFDKNTVRAVFSGGESYEKRSIKLSGDERQVYVVGPDGVEDDLKPIFRDQILRLDMVDKGAKGSTFIIQTNKNIDYKFLYLHKPERFVVDLDNVNYDDSVGVTQFPETRYVKNVRFGLATIGKPVTRMVFDLKQENLQASFKVSDDEEKLYLNIAPNAVYNKIEDQPGSKESINAPIKAVNSAGRKVVIDPGHGGYDPGAVYDYKNEKDITLAISRKVKKYLTDAGIRAYLTRSEDRFISLNERTEISKSIGPDLFVSIHANALATNPRMDGLQTYYYSASGYQVAKVTHKEMLDMVGMPNRNIRKARFWVCRYTKAPSILIETGFMTNKAELKKLISSSYQDKLAKSIASGIIKYLERK
jgi:N-acetylmuramoyl-L-alanine amidase